MGYGDDGMRNSFKTANEMLEEVEVRASLMPWDVLLTSSGSEYLTLRLRIRVEI